MGYYATNKLSVLDIMQSIHGHGLWAVLRSIEDHDRQVKDIIRLRFALMCTIISCSLVPGDKRTLPDNQPRWKHKTNTILLIGCCNSCGIAGTEYMLING